MKENDTATLFVLVFCTINSTSFVLLSSASSVLDDIAKPPPLDFNTTVATNCNEDPTLRYCDLSHAISYKDLVEIYQSMVVANHLCNESGNRDCNVIFSDINLPSRPDVAPLYLSFSSFWRFCPSTITTVNLSDNKLKGSFPSRVLQCRQMQTLDLSHNNFIGYLPIRNISLLTNLTTLDLSYNLFSGNVPTTGFFERFNSSTSFFHSGLSRQATAMFDPSASTVFLLGFLVAAIVALAVLEILFLRRPDFLPEFLRRRFPHRFTPSMIVAATKGFDGKNALGKNGKYEIYKGVLRDGRVVAVEIRRDHRFSRKERKAFVEECEILVQVRHPNIVQVLGWCDSRELRAVVKEWLGNLSVEEWLTTSQGNDDEGPSWHQRLKVGIGIANALCYLDDEWPTVGFDLRLGSVIITTHREPCLYRLKVENQVNAYKRSYKLGVFVMELISNRCGREDFEQGEPEMVDWMRKHFPGRTKRVMDERMKKTVGTCDQVRQVISIALMCTDRVLERRPSIGQATGMISQVYTAPPVWKPADEESRGKVDGRWSFSHTQIT